MKERLLILVAVLAVMLVPVVVNAQSCNFDLRYDPQSAATITGTVITTISYNPANPMNAPQSVLVQSGNQIYNVFLGPGQYVNRLGLNLYPGNTLSVVGSLRIISDNIYLVASTVYSGNRVYRFRSASGIPIWGVIMPGLPVGSGPGYNMTYVPFNPNKIITVSGRIVSITQVQTSESVEPSLQVVIVPRSGYSRRSTVLLGPASFLAQNGIQITQNSALYVSGSEVDTANGRLIVGMIVRQGDWALSLRTVNGIPLFVTSDGYGYISNPSMVQ